MFCPTHILYHIRAFFQSKMAEHNLYFRLVNE